MKNLGEVATAVIIFAVMWGMVFAIAFAAQRILEPLICEKSVCDFS